MNVMIREDLRELAAHWAYVLIEDRRLSANGIDRVIAALREECEVMLARNSPELGDGPVSPRPEPGGAS